MENQGIVQNEDQENNPMELKLTVASVASAALAAMPDNPKFGSESGSAVGAAGAALASPRTIKPKPRKGAVAAGGLVPS